MITVDTHNFNAMLRQLKGMTGAEFKDVVRGEVSSVLEGAMRNTKSAKESKIRYHYTSPITAKGRPRMLEMNGKMYSLNRRYPDSLWDQIVAFEAANEKEALARRGLSKQSWLRIAESLGMRLRKVPLYVRGAKVKGSTYPMPVRSSEAAMGARYLITIENSLNVLVKIGGRAALQKAINGRVGYYVHNVRHGVFKRVATIAKAYPGIRVSGI
jgi:hypothetical protein